MLRTVRLTAEVAFLGPLCAKFDRANRLVVKNGQNLLRGQITGIYVDSPDAYKFSFAVQGEFEEEPKLGRATEILICRQPKSMDANQIKILARALTVDANDGESKFRWTLEYSN